MIGRRVLAATVVVAAVAAGGVAGAVLGIPGLSGASTTSTTTPKPELAPHEGGMHGRFGGAGKDVLDAAAKALNLSTADLMQKLSDGTTTIADVAKQQNVDVQTVIDAMDAVAKTDISNLVNNPLPVPPAFKGGPGGPGGFAAPGLGFRSFGGDPAAAAKALGISPQELMTDLRDGKSIADIAKTKNVSVNSLIDTLVNDAKSKIDAAVKAGHLTQDQATKLETNLKDRISNLVNNAGFKGLGQFGGGHGRRFGFGPNGFPRPVGPPPAPDAAPTA